MNLWKTKKYLGLDIEPFYFDKGCRSATLYLQMTVARWHKSQCEKCPFPACIEDVSEMEKNYLNFAFKIRNMFLLYDQGLSLLQIVHDLQINYRFARECLQARPQVIKLLDTWAEIVKHPVQFKYDTIIKAENYQLELVKI